MCLLYNVCYLFLQKTTLIQISSINDAIPDLKKIIKCQNNYYIYIVNRILVHFDESNYCKSKYK